MKAVLLLQRRVVLAQDAFVELVIWRLSQHLAPSTHRFKYRLAYVVEGECVVLYDSDHRHFDRTQRAYDFSSTERLLADFNSDIARWNRENGRA
jgi:uncharacterized protein DUF6516